MWSAASSARFATRDGRDVGQEPTVKPVQPADSPRNQMLDVSLGVFIARRCDPSGGRHADEHGRARKTIPRYVALPYPGSSPGLRCSRRRSACGTPKRRIQISSVDHDLCCDNEMYRHACEVACWLTTEVAARSGNPKRGPSAGQTRWWAGAEGGSVRLAPG